MRIARPAEELGAAVWLLARAARGSVADAVEGDGFAHARLATAIDTYLWRPLLTLCALTGLAGVIVGLTASSVLKLYQADLAVAPAVAKTLVRDICPLLVGLFAAGRVSVALAARLSGMRAGRELEALEALGLDPARYVLSPTLAALILATPVHACLSSAVALVTAGMTLQGGAVLPWGRYLSLVLTPETAAAALQGVGRVLIFYLIAAGVGAATGSGQSVKREGADRDGAVTAAFTVGLLTIFTAAVILTALH